MSVDEMLTAAKASLEAYNAKDWDAARASMAEDCVYDEAATHLRAEGVGAIIDAWKGWATAIPDSKATIESSYAIDGGAVLELTWRGTQTGPMMGPEGEIPATGKSFEMRSCQIIEMQGDRAVSIRHYFDLATMMSQLGLVQVGSFTATWL